MPVYIRYMGIAAYVDNDLVWHSENEKLKNLLTAASDVGKAAQIGTPFPALSLAEQVLRDLPGNGEIIRVTDKPPDLPPDLIV